MHAMMKAVVLGSTVASASVIGGREFTNTTGGVVYTTEVVTALTTYCPAAGTITVGSKTYTVTEATTLTITDCPCTVSKPVQPTGTPGKDECPKKCYDAYNVCRGAPDANFSFCASEYAGCLGYNPFGGDGSLITPTACSSPAPTHTATPQECAKGCYDAYNKCRGAPDANFSFCGSEYAGCLGYNPFGGNGTLATPTACSSKTTAVVTTPCPTETKVAHDCAAECSVAYNKCRGQTGANMSFCASEYASCLGYSPFGGDGSLITPTACSKPAPVTTAGPTATGTTPSGNKDCAAECYTAYNQCRGKSGANMSFCASEFSSCLGYSPFDNNGSLVTPTACSAGATGKPTGSMPVGGQATGTVSIPAATGTPPAVVAGKAGHNTPALALLALGAVALL